MGLTKSATSKIRKLTKLGGTSLAVTIPRAILKKLNWREKQKLVIKLEGKKVVIKDWKPKKG